MFNKLLVSSADGSVALSLTEDTASLKALGLELVMARVSGTDQVRIKVTGLEQNSQTLADGMLFVVRPLQPAPVAPEGPPHAAITQRKGKGSLTRAQQDALNWKPKDLDIHPRQLRVLQQNKVFFVGDAVAQGAALFEKPYLKGEARKKFLAFMRKKQLSFDMNLSKWHRPV